MYSFVCVCAPPRTFLFIQRTRNATSRTPLFGSSAATAIYCSSGVHDISVVRSESSRSFCSSADHRTVYNDSGSAAAVDSVAIMCNAAREDIPLPFPVVVVVVVGVFLPLIPC